MATNIENTVIKLQGSEGKLIGVALEIAYMSPTLKNLVEDLGLDDDDDKEFIPLPNINEETLNKIINWCNHHKDDKNQPDEDGTFEMKAEDIAEWDKKFYDVDQALLLNLINAAYYLNLQVMLEIGCHVVAGIIRSKSIEELRDFMQIKNDFTPEEEEALKRENAWLDEI